jgi:hypothetical protein
MMAQHRRLRKIPTTPFHSNTVKPLIFGDNIGWTNSGMGFWLPEEMDKITISHPIPTRLKTVPNNPTASCPA